MIRCDCYLSLHTIIIFLLQVSIYTLTIKAMTLLSKVFYNNYTSISNKLEIILHTFIVVSLNLHMFQSNIIK